MLESLLGNEMLYNSWVHVLHITHFWSRTIYWKPSVTNHFDLFVINKDDNQHVFQSCIGLVNRETFMANTIIAAQCLLTVFGKNGYNPKTISNLTVTIFNQQHYHYCWCKTWNMDNNKSLFICYTNNNNNNNNNNDDNNNTLYWQLPTRGFSVTI